MKKKLIALLLCLAMPAALAACGDTATSGSTSGGGTSSSAASSASKSTESKSESTASSSASSAAGEYEKIDLNNDVVWGDVGPDGSVPAGLDDVMLTDEEVEPGESRKL